MAQTTQPLIKLRFVIQHEAAAGLERRVVEYFDTSAEICRVLMSSLIPQSDKYKQLSLFKKIIFFFIY